ncbi:MAG TPA: glycosyltransferase family 2 protein [Phycisphaerae bacterium]|nr:glycosyltransferase family 2 protein [Phycisphaerae bacterium]
MRVRLTEAVHINGAFKFPSDGPQEVDAAFGEQLIAEGKAKAFDGPPVDKMIRSAARKATVPEAPVKKAPEESARKTLRRTRAGSATTPTIPDAGLWVVIPTKGRASDLDRTLAAAFFQAPPLGGIVIVSDGPDAPTQAVVTRWKQTHNGKIHYVVLDEQQGVAAARIRGNAEVPEHAVIVEVDDHDAPEPGALRLVADQFEHAGVQVVYGDKYRLDAAGRLVDRISRSDYREGAFREDGNHASGMRAYRKSLYTAVGGRRPEEKLASEYALCLRFEAFLGANAGDAIRHIAAPLCRCPCVGDGISIRNHPEQTVAAEHYAYMALTGSLFPPREGGTPMSAVEPPPPLLLDGNVVPAFPLPSPPPEVSVVIPCYKSTAHVGPLVESLAADSYAGAREIIWVIDADEEKYPDLPGKVVMRQTRGGFGAAVNTGAGYATGRHLCLLNADTTVTPGWLGRLCKVLNEHPSVGAVGPTIVRPDGQVDSVGSEYDYVQGNWPHLTTEQRTHERDMMTAACLLIRKGLWDTIGGIDEAYKLGYWEDTDLCMRIRHAGYMIRHEPGATITHAVGHSRLGQKHPTYQANRNLFHRRWVASGLVDKFATERRRNIHRGRVCVCILALNESEYIEACLESVYPLADRIIIVEGGNAFSAAFGACDKSGRSTDGQQDAIERFARERDHRNIVEVYRPDRPWRDKTEARQFYLKKLQVGDWCLAVDADEVFWESTLWRLSMAMHEADYITADWLLLWRDFQTAGRGVWEKYRLDMRFFRVGDGYRYNTHLKVVNKHGVLIDQASRKTHLSFPLVAHYAWVKPLAKIRAKLEYYRRQCPDTFMPQDYVDRIFRGWGADPAGMNAIGTHPMGKGTCEPWTGAHPEPIARRLAKGMFGWVRELEGK